jgi:UDP-N-acetylmuramyl pentapeptide synthase
MKVLVVDMTHGGILIASEFMKIPELEVLALDIYKTMNPSKIKELEDKGIILLESLDDLNEDNQLSESDVMIVAPVHCKLDISVNMSHHEAVGLLLKQSINIPIIEITGVKGKTSVVWILKEIFKGSNPLVLSSLGVEVVEDGKWKVLKKDISITPASIIEAWKLAEGYEIGLCIFETSLGGTGLADVGILTNLIEDYTIADSSSVASVAKSQIFKSKIVICEIDSFNTRYSEFKEKTNTFGISNVNSKKRANIIASNCKLGFDKSKFKIDIVDFKTSGSNILNESFEVSTFAPTNIHVNNVLAAVGASLTLDVPLEIIKKGLNNFNGVKGRTSIKNYKGIRIIEDVNPGLNVAAVKIALMMLEGMDNVGVIFGGKYGITCEEIDEKSVSTVLEDINNKIPLILVDELGEKVKNFLKRKFIYRNDLDDAINCAVDNACSNLLIIYRSNYSDIKKR